MFAVQYKGRKINYEDDNRINGIIEQHCELLVNAEGQDYNRSLNILCDIFAKKSFISDNDGVLTERAKQNEKTISEYAEKYYYKKRLMSYEELIKYVMDSVFQIYIICDEELLRKAAIITIDKAIQISEEARNNGKIPGGICRIEEQQNGIPSVLFVEKPFIDELVQTATKEVPGMFYDYLQYDFDMDKVMKSIRE